MKNKFDDMQSDNFDETKRKSLIKMGKRAAYVTPVVLTLLTSQKATASSQCHGSCGYNNGGHNNGGHNNGGHNNGGHNNGGHNNGGHSYGSRGRR